MKIPPFLAASPLLLLAAAFFPGHADAQSSKDRERSALMDYIYGPDADPSCGVCLKAAAKRQDDLKRSALARRTSGMVLVPAGPHTLGSPEGTGDPDEKPAGEIFLDAFFIDKHEVTVSEYLDFAKQTSGNYPEWAVPNGKFNMETGKDTYYHRLRALVKTCGKCAAFGMDWKGAKAYCEWKKKRLPTEAEWEAAARAGSKEAYSFGLEMSAPEYAWIDVNAKEIPHPVGRKKPNAWGLFDMHGNVWEWVADLYDKGYYAARPNKNPPGPGAGKDHVIRGGSWAGDADHARSGNRASAKQANDDIGLRCVVSEADILRETAGGL